MFQILRCLFLLFLYFIAKSVKCSPFLALSWSSSFAFSSGFDKKFFMDSHGSLPAPVGNDCGGLFRSDDTVPCERLTISLAKNATETVRFCLSQHLISLAIVYGLSLISCGASSLASRHKDFLIRIRVASQHCSQLQLSWATIMHWISVFLPKCNWTYLHKPCPHILQGTVTGFPLHVVVFPQWSTKWRNSVSVITTPWVWWRNFWNLQDVRH